MSDLQCACTALVLGPVSPDRARELCSGLRGRRIAGVFGVAGSVGPEAAESLGVPHERLEVDGSGPAAAIESVSDSYRGETVLIVCDLDALAPPYAVHELVEVAIDADGWVFVRTIS